MTRDFRRFSRSGVISQDFARTLEEFDRDATVLKIADNRIGETAVTQHQAALDIAATQLTGTLLNATVAESNVKQHEAALVIDTAQLTGSLPDVTVTESSVTQHEAALSIAQSQITDPFGHYVAAVENTDTTTDLAGTGVTIPINGGTVHIDAAEYATSGDGIEVTTAGRHRVSAVVDSTGDPITLRLSVNGTATGPIGVGSVSAILDLSASDVVTVEASGAVSTTTLSASGTSALSVETWR